MFSSIISEDFSERKDDRKGKEKSWYIADIFTDESEDEKDDCVAGSFKATEASDTQRVDGLPEKEEGREHPRTGTGSPLLTGSTQRSQETKSPRKRRRTEELRKEERTRRKKWKRSLRSTKKRKTRSVQRDTRTGKSEPRLTLPQKRKTNRSSPKR